MRRSESVTNDARPSRGGQNYYICDLAVPPHHLLRSFAVLSLLQCFGAMWMSRAARRPGTATSTTLRSFLKNCKQSGWPWEGRGGSCSSGTKRNHTITYFRNALVVVHLFAMGRLFPASWRSHG